MAKKVVPKLEVKVLFGFTEKQLESPKFYYLYFKDKKFKKPAFSLLNSLEKERLAPSLKGLFVRVKGKKGTRKDRKTISLGQVKKHSPIKSIKEYTGTLETPLGTTGIQVKLLRKKDCIDYSLERNFKLAQASPLNLSELSSKKT